MRRAQSLTSPADFKRIQTELGYTPLEAMARIGSQPSTKPIIISPRGSDFTYSWNIDCTEDATQKNHDAEKLASTIDYFTTVKHVAKARKGNGALARLNQKLRGDFQDNWMMTGTRAVYNPENQTDTLIHDWRSSRETRYDVALVGDDGLLENLPDAEALTKAYFGTNNVRDAVAVIQAVTGKKPSIWRQNQKPIQTIERPVVLGLSNYRNSFVFGAVYAYGGSARGVAVTPKKS